jgi:hypothetical protein
LSAWQESPGFFPVHNPVAYSTVRKVIDTPGDDIAADNDNGDDNDNEDSDNNSNKANWL